MTDNAPTAMSAFLQALAAVEEELAELQSKANNHFYIHPDEVSWGDVADLRRVLVYLKGANTTNKEKTPCQTL